MFVAADLCRVLGIRNVSDALASLDGDEKGLAITETPGGPQAMAVVAESGIYSLIMRSRKPEARAFRRWVTGTVLPAIRRTGGYVPAESVPAGSSLAALTPRDLARLILAEADRADAAEQHAAALLPAADAWTALGDAVGDYSLREAALILTRDLGIETGQNRLMTALREMDMVDSRGRPYARHNTHLVARPVTWTHPSGEPRLSYQIRVTVAGLEYLRKRLGTPGNQSRSCLQTSQSGSVNVRRAGW
jgi:prophage antirepressor-like protein